MPSQFQDLDLQDIQFLMETAALTQASLARDSLVLETEEYDPTIVVDLSIDVNKAFPLINKVLPFEACLYHQILPLYIEDNQIFLGMVNLDDSAALDYARKILAFLKYKVITQTIASDAHHRVLSAYLSYQAHLESQPALPPPANPEPTTEIPIGQTTSEQILDPALHQTPDPAKDAIADATADPTSLPETFQLPHQDVLTQWPHSAHAVAHASLSAAAKSAQVKSKVPAKPVQSIPGSALPELEIQPVSGNLRSLPPKAFLQALLIRVIQSGVGRLFLARQAGLGRVLWTESGTVKAVLEDLDVAQLQGTIDELKALTHLPIEPVRKPVEVEIERIYQKQRVLLRLRITPKPTGEEATLQILRGAALKFYQQQQMKVLSRDTLTIAEQLRYKIIEFQKRTQTVATEQDREMLPELDWVIKDLEKQLMAIKQIRSTIG